MRPFLLTILVLAGCTPDGDWAVLSDNHAALPVFSSPIANGSTLGELYALAWGDFDEDGDQDLFVGTGGPALVPEPDRLYINDDGVLNLDLTGKLDPTPTLTADAAWGDVDGDGDLDLAVARQTGGSVVYENDDGDLTSPLWAGPTDTATAIALADLDGDADLDLMLGRASANLLYFQNSGGFAPTGFEANSGATSALAVGRSVLNNDLAIAQSPGGEQDVNVWYWDGGLIGQSVDTHLPGDISAGLSWADVDGTLEDDLVVAFTNASTRVCFGAAQPSGFGFCDPVPDLFIGAGRAPVWGDADGDGDGDLAVAHEGEFDRFWTYVQDPQPGLDSPSEASPTAVDSVDAAWADLDGDGGLELAVAALGEALLLYEDPSLSFAISQLGIPVQPTAMSWADVNCDSAPDLGYADGTEAGFLRDNGTSYVPETLSRGVPVGQIRDFAWADLNNDKAPDIILATDGVDPVEIYLGADNCSDYVFTTPVIEFGDLRIEEAVAPADYDGDGDVDLAFAVAQPQNVVEVYPNSGDPAGFLTASPITFTTITDPFDVAWGDADGNGLPELAIAGLGGIAILSNSGGGLGDDQATVLGTAHVKLRWWQSDDAVGEELAAATDDGAVHLYERVSDTNWLEITSTPGGFPVDDITSADVDGDGIDEIFVSRQNGPPTLYRREGNSLVERFTGLSNLAVTGLAAFDYDNDGDVDLFGGVDDNGPKVRVWEGGRGGGPSSARAPVVPAHVRVDDLWAQPTAVEPAVFEEPWAASHVVTAPGVVFELFGPEGEVAREVEVEISLHGGAWQPLLVGESLNNLAAGPEGIAHELTWAPTNPAFSSSAARLRVTVPYQVPTRVGGSFQFGRRSVTSLPFVVETSACDVAVDEDSDGFNQCVDCDDSIAAINSAAIEVCNDGVDNDCENGDEQTDDDGDGYLDESCLDGDDCDDLDPTVNPGVDVDADGSDACEDCDDADDGRFPANTELADDGIDQDCTGFDLLTCIEDGDGDGALGTEVTDDGPSCAFLGYPTTGPYDCDDTNPDRYAGATELCNGIDDNCDGTVSSEEGDFDGDGFMPCSAASDCDDNNADTHTGASEICDGDDNDCNGAIPSDEVDHDGDQVLECDGDCGPTNDLIRPGALEICDGEDSDCDGTIPADELDGDGDGFSPCEGDCDDTNSAIFSSSAEVCDGIDNDCDGAPTLFELDLDGDGVFLCDGDCNDNLATVYAGAPELCDGLDNDCDYVVPTDEADADSDGYMVCDDGSGLTDCDDSNAATSPVLSEVCDGQDNDCDGVIPPDEDDADGDFLPFCDDECGDDNPNPPEDEIPGNGIDEDCDGVDAVLCYQDTDEDGVPVWANTLVVDSGVCPPQWTEAPTEACAQADDCDDTNQDRHPCFEDEEALCDGIDHDCDETVFLSSGSQTEVYFDLDGDGHGSEDSLNSECADVPEGFADTNDDCDDDEATVHPSAQELCNLIDHDCDGLPFNGFIPSCTDSTVPACMTADQDGDCYDADLGDGSQIDPDCDDGDPSVNPAAEEVCDGIDNDCDGILDDITDNDGDGASTCAGCEDLAPSPFFPCDDCDDDDPNRFEGNLEICDGIDNDCDDEIDPIVDADGDGASNCAECEDLILPEGQPCEDCDDDEPLVNRLNTDDPCDGLDNDCDGVVDLITDEDGDGSLTCADCEDLEPSALFPCDDCDDGNADVHPGALEICDDTFDNDCDGVTDPTIDADEDGAANCPECSDATAQGDFTCDDCDDDEPLVNRLNTDDPCDGLDNDCDGVVDVITDEDGDGSLTCADCEDLEPSALFPCDDCDDGNANVHPGALEICDDTVDNDCDGAEEYEGGDPDCWPTGCGGCSAGGSEGAGLGLFGLLLLGLRRRRSSAGAAIAAVAVLLVASPAFAQEPSANVSAMQAAAAADLETARDALLELRAAGTETNVGLRNVLEARFGELDLLFTSPVDAAGTVEVTWEGGRFVAPLAKADYTAVAAVPAGYDLVLTVRVLGYHPERIELGSLRPRELRAAAVVLRASGRGKVTQIAAAEGLDLTVEVAGRWAALDTGQSAEVTAGAVGVAVSDGRARAAGVVDVAKNGELQADPERWRLTSLTLDGVPEGSRVGVFVEGADGFFVDATTSPGGAGATDPTTGVPVLTTVTVDGLVPGATGLYLEHPVLGARAEELSLTAGTPGAVSFDLSTLEGTAAIQLRWEERQAELLRIKRQTTGGTAAGIGMAVGGIVAGSVLGLFASDSEILAAQAQSAGAEAVARHDWDGLAARRADYDAAVGDQRAYTVGAIIAGAIGGVGVGLTIAMPLEGRASKQALGPWRPW